MGRHQATPQRGEKRQMGPHRPLHDRRSSRLPWPSDNVHEVYQIYRQRQGPIQKFVSGGSSHSVQRVFPHSCPYAIWPISPKHGHVRHTGSTEPHEPRRPGRRDRGRGVAARASRCARVRTRRQRADRSGAAIRRPLGTGSDRGQSIDRQRRRGRPQHRRQAVAARTGSRAPRPTKSACCAGRPRGRRCTSSICANCTECCWVW